MPQSTSTITTAIWDEDASDQCIFQAVSARCHGFDLHDTLMPRASWAAMLLLLFKGEQPSAADCKLLNALAVALANPGPRDPSVHAAMAAGATGAPIAAALMAALSVGAGRRGGAREVYDCMVLWGSHGRDVSGWTANLGPRPIDKIWPASDFAAGFDATGPAAGPLALKTLDSLLNLPQAPDSPLHWLRANLAELEGTAQGSLSHTMVSALAFAQLGLAPKQGEALYLLLRLAGAAAHALEQSAQGYTAFPFPRIELVEEGTL